ncbi:MAG TPA: S-formylglutathione hydrolase [Rudaea sp.]|nr:S-formylglutathione hydrolase [Rudaea sp.]
MQNKSVEPNLQVLSERRCFDGVQGVYRHASASCNGPMQFAVYQPPQAQLRAVPVLYFLSGLTCTEENFTIKAGAQRMAAQLGLLLVVPDTSPRNTGIPGEADAEDFGAGAGFYLDATQLPWSQHFKMYTYVTQELPGLIGANFPADMSRQSVFGHSMGGHGALTIALKNPQRYRSVSAFAPIVAPTQVRWGKGAFARYLGDNQQAWQQYDACALIAQGKRFDGEILIDQGDADQFLHETLRPQLFETACRAAGQPLRLRMQAGYDHSYYFIASFVEDHLRHHAAALAT